MSEISTLFQLRMEMKYFSVSVHFTKQTSHAECTYTFKKIVTAMKSLCLQILILFSVCVNIFDVNTYSIESLFQFIFELYMKLANIETFTSLFI